MPVAVEELEASLRVLLRRSLSTSLPVAAVRFTSTVSSVVERSARACSLAFELPSVVDRLVEFEPDSSVVERRPFSALPPITSPVPARRRFESSVLLLVDALLFVPALSEPFEALRSLEVELLRCALSPRRPPVPTTPLSLVRALSVAER